jgi:PleD family two-component response regulator
MNELLVLADKALYLAKSRGRNNVQFASQRHQAEHQSAAA